MTRLLITNKHGPSDNSRLLLVGRKSKLETSIALTVDVRGRSATVQDDDLGIFGSETVDLLVIDDPDDLSLRRQRLEAPQYEQSPAPGRRHRWYATAEGSLSVRPRSEVELIAESGVFDEDYYRAQAPALPADIDSIEHYVAKGAAEGLNPSEMFDTSYYRRLNPRVRRRNPLAHYCDEGWREMFNPSPRFDTWWYWAKHLDLADDSTNPLAHWQTIGRHEGLSTVPNPHPSRRLSVGHTFDPERKVRRVCLFAAYDLDGIVDEYVLDYITELAQYADVYYLADREMPESELSKLAGITMGAWGVRHGQYDFGSYARLADLVGWNAIEEYDELLLVNDSCYLLRPLDHVFTRMDRRSCDWWGMQATKGIYQTRREPANQFLDPISMDSVRSVLIDRFEQDYVYDFLLGSFFVAYRKPVIIDPEFRRYLRSVTVEPTKRHIVKKHEIGLTRWLIQLGHSFDTFMPHLYPFHPVFTRWYFRMVDGGFPLLKRLFLSDNLYGSPGLIEWPRLITERVPGARVEAFERNLVRVTDPDKLRRSLNVGSQAGVADPPPSTDPLSRAEFIQADAISPKHVDWWAFPVDESTGAFTGNVRAVFEEVKDDPSLHKIILTRGRDIVSVGVNVETVALESAQGQHRLMRAGTIFIERSIDASIHHPVSSELHNLIRVGRHSDGVLGHAATASPNEFQRQVEHQACFRAVVSSSTVDALVATAASYPLTLRQVWTTGMPRNDFILRNDTELPVDFQADSQRLEALLNDHQLILYTPSLGVALNDYLSRAEDVDWVKTWLIDNDAVLGIREQASGATSVATTRLPTLNLSVGQFAHVEILYRASSAMIVENYGDFVDYLLTGGPVIGLKKLAWDEPYDRGSPLAIEQIFPGPICRSFTDLQTALESAMTRPIEVEHEVKRRLLLEGAERGSSTRVARKVRDLAVARGIGKPLDERTA